MTGRRFAPATDRNRGAIADILRRVLPAQGVVLEIACGSGQHAAYIAPQLPGLTWQPTDPDPEACASADAWAAGATNIARALILEAERPWPVAHADAIVCINMVHIAPWSASVALLAGAGRCLPPGGILYLYGPYRFGDTPLAPSNESFDASLKSRDPRWGLRDVSALTSLAAANGLSLIEAVAMPANNHSLIFRHH